MNRVLLFAGLAALALAQPAAAAVDVQESGAAGATLVFQLGPFSITPAPESGAAYSLVQADGLTLYGLQGAPALPVESILLAAPHGARVSVTVVSKETEWISGITPIPWPSESIDDGGTLPHAVAESKPDDRFYAAGGGGGEGYPQQGVEIKEIGTLRGHRLVSVLFRPFSYDPGRGGLEVWRRIEARVTFDGGADVSPVPSRSGDRRWEPVLKGLVSNFENGKVWRKGSTPAMSVSRSRASQDPSYRILVRNSSLHRVFFDDLAALGSIDGVDVDELRLYERSYSSAQGSSVEREIPILVEDIDSDGTFESGESFVFYGLSYWDRYPQKYAKWVRTRPHVYWLSLSASGGARMESTPSWGEYTNPETPLSFAETLHLHEDHVLNRAPHSADVHMFWFHAMLADETFPFEVPSPDPASSYGVNVRFQPLRAHTHRFNLFAQNAGGAVDTVETNGLFLSISLLPAGKPPYTYNSGPVGKPGFLSEGANSLRIVGERLVEGGFIPGISAFLDWFEIEYYRRYAAWNDTLTCTAGGSGSPQHIKIDGFDSSSLLAFDVTDPFNPKVFDLDSRNVSAAGENTFTLAIRGEFPARSRIAAAASGAVRPVDPEDIERDAPSDLMLEGSGADYIAVVYDGFVDEIAPLVELREGQGFKVAVAKASDVYDEFGDGYKSSEAIKNYLAYAYNNWGSAYGLLVGDANEDTENILTEQDEPTPPDFVPTRLHLHEGVPTSTAGPELVNSDAWFGVHLDGDTRDWVPDMFIGRLPAGSAEETRAMVDKIVRYENFGAADQWRSRGLLVADDAYSSSIFSNKGYCFSSAENSYFEPINRRISAMLEDEENGVPGFEAPMFNLDDYLGAFPDDPKKTCYNGFELTDQIWPYVRANVTPVLVDTMSLGWLFVSYQGHGNENVWTHEDMFISYPGLGGRDDVFDLGNTGRPFILFAFSCHINDFDDKRESHAGDCMGERMMILPEAGAVAVYASGGYEYLSTGPFNEHLIEALLVDPPVEEEEDEVFIRLGPAIAKGGVSYLGVANYLNSYALQTFCTLGDPAMRIDSAAPRIVAAIGDMMLVDGGRIENATGSDTLGIRFEIRDEVAVDSTSIYLREIWHRTEGQDSTYNVPPSEYVASRGNKGRFYSVDYTLNLLPASMEMIAGAVDRNGRSSSITLLAVLSAVWEADGRPLSQDDLVGATADLVAKVSSPVPITGERLAVTVDGARAGAFVKRQTDLEGMEWELSSPGYVLAEGWHSLSLLVDGRPVKTVAVSVDSRFRFASIMPYPNPCDEKGTTFFYELTSTGSAEISDITLKIYSVSGRLVAELHDPDPAIGRGSIHWGAVDDHGDRVSNGIYICKAVATGFAGAKASTLVKVALAR
jgi:hypothetical protein